MPTQDHTDLLTEIRKTRTVRGSLLLTVNSIHQRMKVALDGNGGNGDLAALRALCADLGPDHRDDIANALVAGTQVGSADKDADPTAPTPASNPASLGGNVYGSLGPEDTDVTRPGGAGGNRRELTPAEIEARGRGEAAVKAREAAEGEKLYERDPAVSAFFKAHDEFQSRPTIRTEPKTVPMNTGAARPRQDAPPAAAPKPATKPAA